MKKKNKTITNPDELNKSLSYSSPITWITLSTVIILLIGFFVWSFIYKIQIKVSGLATINSGNVTLHVDDSDLSSLKQGQYVYISGQKGEIISINESDKQPVVSSFSLDDGEYNYYIVIDEKKPIDFWFDKQ